MNPSVVAVFCIVFLHVECRGACGGFFAAHAYATRCGLYVARRAVSVAFAPTCLQRCMFRCVRPSSSRVPGSTARFHPPSRQRSHWVAAEHRGTALVTHSCCLQAVLSDARDRRTRLLEALRMKYKQIRGGGRSGRYKKGPDTDVKRRLELEIEEIDQQGTLPDDDWMDEENVRAYLEYLHTGAAAATVAAATASQVWPRQHDAP